MSLREQVEGLFAKGGEFTPTDREVFDAFKQALNRGEVRAAERGDDGAWRVNSWVKRGILVGFRMGALTDMSAHASLRFFDKDTYPVRATTIMDNVRIVPGGSSVRDGTYLAPGVVCMPPMYVNAGAYVDEGTMIDSHALVGSCAQVGKRVHLSAAARVGAVALRARHRQVPRREDGARREAGGLPALTEFEPARRLRGIQKSMIR